MQTGLLRHIVAFCPMEYIQFFLFLKQKKRSVLLLSCRPFYNVTLLATATRYSIIRAWGDVDERRQVFGTEEQNRHQGE